jgi:uncharacterized protein (DUF433 family)
MTDQAAVPTTVDLSKYIEVRIFGERPHIRGRRIPVATIAYSHQDPGWNVAELAYNFGLSEPQVLAALLYYEENKDLIDAQEVAYQAELDEAYRLYGPKD